MNAKFASLSTVKAPSSSQSAIDYFGLTICFPKHTPKKERPTAEDITLALKTHYKKDELTGVHIRAIIVGWGNHVNLIKEGEAWRVDEVYFLKF